MNDENTPKNTLETEHLQSVAKKPPDSTDFTAIKELSKGGYFGEIAILTNLKRTASVCSMQHSTVASLMRK